jgi:HK97 gp10 family phage protein
MDDFTTEIKGLDELQHALEELPRKVAQRGLRKALKSGAGPVQEGMVNLAPKYAGNDTRWPIGFLAEHFGVKVKIGRDELSGSAFIGPQGKIDYPMFASGAYKIVRNAKNKAIKVGRIAVTTVARFLEFGTSKMPKQPFMTQAFDTNKEAALENITHSLAETVSEVAEEGNRGPRVS